MTKICIIGCGTYGSYLLRRLVEVKGDKVEITVIEMGCEKIQSESEIGIASESVFSHAAERGRYFGLGGTSARWGGQVLFFDERDNPDYQADWNTIVQVNKKYKTTVLEKLLGNVPNLNTILTERNNEKTGIWLKYRKRNLFKGLSKTILNTAKILKNQRVTDFKFENSTIKSVICKDKTGNEQNVFADVFYLTAGAIESCRLLLVLKQKYKLITSSDLGKNYGDHISVELFKIIGHKPLIKGTNFLPNIKHGSLITKRWLVKDSNNRIGFAHPIFNQDIKVFTSIKRMLFGRQQFEFKAKDIFEGIEFLARFGVNVLFLKKMYAHRNSWSIRLDLEQAYPNNNTISLSEKTDDFEETGVCLNWTVSKSDLDSISAIKEDLEAILIKENIPYSNVFTSKVEDTKIEDVYHPVGFIRMGHDDNAVLDMDCKVRGIQNLYHFSTAMFPSAKSINPTAAGFCFIEQNLN